MENQGEAKRQSSLCRAVWSKMHVKGRSRIVHLSPKNQRCRMRDYPIWGFCLAITEVWIPELCQSLCKEGKQALWRWTGCPKSQTCLVHFRTRVGGLCALSNPRVNSSNTARQPMGFWTSCFFYIQIRLLPTIHVPFASLGAWEHQACNSCWRQSRQIEKYGTNYIILGAKEEDI